MIGLALLEGMNACTYQITFCKDATSSFINGLKRIIEKAIEQKYINLILVLRTWQIITTLTESSDQKEGSNACLKPYSEVNIRIIPSNHNKSHNMNVSPNHT
jgi:hypothetical protein